MAREIKTFPVIKFKEEINSLLRRDDDFMTEDRREMLCLILERVLFDTKNYHGFAHVDWENGLCQKWNEDGCPDFPIKQLYFGPEYKRRYF